MSSLQSSCFCATLFFDLLLLLFLFLGNTSSNFLSIDFIKNPSNSEADYGLTVNLEQIEIIYHEVQIMLKSAYK